MKFGTIYDRYQHFADPGNPIHDLYTMQINDDGVEELVKTGEEDLHELINSYAESVDIHVILDKYKNGDTEALNQRMGSFGDFTDVPTSAFEIYRTIANGEAEFDKLPTDIKEKFDNSFNRFVALAGTDAWFKAITPEEKEFEKAGDNNESEQ